MAGREVREYTNLSDPKDKKRGKGKGRIDEEDITFQRLVAKMHDVSGDRGGYLHGRGALDSDDLLYLKEQMEAEKDAERLLRRTEKRAFAAFKRAASLADSTPPPLPLPLRVEPKQKSGIRQQDFLKNVLEIRPKRLRVSSPSDGTQGENLNSMSLQPTKDDKSGGTLKDLSSSKSSDSTLRKDVSSSKPNKNSSSKSLTSNDEPKEDKPLPEKDAKSLLGLAYESSDEDA